MNNSLKQKHVSPGELKTVLKNVLLKHKSLSSPESLSSPNDDDMIKLKPILPQLFNLSNEQINIIKDKSNGTSILKIISSLLNIDEKSIRKFVKYMASITNGKDKTTSQLKDLIKNRHMSKVKLYELPDDIFNEIHERYIQIVSKDSSPKDSSKLSSLIMGEGESSSDTSEFNTPFQSPKQVSANQLKTILKNKSLSSPNDDDMKQLKPILPQLFNLSMNQIDIINKDVDILKIIASLLQVDVKHVKKFIKYIASIEDGKIKNIEELKSLIKNRHKTYKLYDLPDDILGKIHKRYTEIVPKKYKLRDWIAVDKLSIRQLSYNPNDKAIEMLISIVGKKHKKYNQNIDWENLAANPNDKAIRLLAQYFHSVVNDKIISNLLQNPSNEAIKLLECNQDEIKNKMTWLYLAKNPNDNAIKLLMNIFGDKLNEYADSKFWINLSANPSNKAIELLLKNVRNINWKMLSTNPNTKAIELLEKNRDKIDWYNYLSKNTNDKAIDELLDKYFEENGIEPYDKDILVDNLSKNTSDVAIEILDAYFLPEEFNWTNLSANPNDQAIELLKQNQDKINWESLSKNTNEKVIELLKQNQDKFNWIIWGRLSANPIIFEEIQNSPF